MLASMQADGPLLCRSVSWLWLPLGHKLCLVQIEQPIQTDRNHAQGHSGLLVKGHMCAIARLSLPGAEYVTGMYRSNPAFSHACMQMCDAWGAAAVSMQMLTTAADLKRESLSTGASSMMVRS